MGLNSKIEYNGQEKENSISQFAFGVHLLFCASAERQGTLGIVKGEQGLLGIEKYLGQEAE